MDKVLRLKKSIPSERAAETQSEGSFHPTTTISTRFHNQNASTCRKTFACKNVQKITITNSAPVETAGTFYMLQACMQGNFVIKLRKSVRFLW